MTGPAKTETIALYDRFTHGGMKRRDFMARMVALTGSVAAANLLIGTIAAKSEAAPLSDPKDRRLNVRDQTIAGIKAYVAEPTTKSLKPSVVVIHENRGLNEHIRDVARRVALAGYRAVAPDLLTPLGGTPVNEEKAREMIGKLDLAATTRAGVALLEALAKSSRGGKVGAVGFCWGGAFVDRLAVAAGKGLGAGVSYYGPAPDPSEAATVGAPMLFHLAGLDDRVAGHRLAVRRRARQGRKDGQRQQLCRRQSRLQQRHFDRTLRQGRGRAGVGADARLVRALSGLKKRAAGFPATLPVLVGGSPSGGRP